MDVYIMDYKTVVRCGGWAVIWTSLVCRRVISQLCLDKTGVLILVYFFKRLFGLEQCDFTLKYSYECVYTRFIVSMAARSSPSND